MPFLSTTKDEGMVGGFHFVATTFPSGSWTIGNLTAPWLLPNSTTPVVVSSVEMATISIPLALYFTLSSWSLGNDFLQGSHHVAQKSTMTTFPFSEASEILP